MSDAQPSASAGPDANSHLSDPERKALELRFDRRIQQLYFAYGLQHYVSWSKQPDYRFVAIQSASEIKNGIRFGLFDSEYTITAQRSYSPHIEVSLIVTANGVVVYDARYLEIGDYDDLILLAVNQFNTEGEWLQHLRALVGEVREARKAKGYVDDVSDEEYYGYALQIAGPSEVRCIWGDRCPLLGSERIQTFSDGKRSFWMCEYHWAKFLRAGRDAMTQMPEEPEVKLVNRPRRCGWVGCLKRTNKALERESRVPGIPILFFFCDEHRPAVLKWLDDRNTPVQFRYWPSVEANIRLWLASRNGWHRLWLVTISLAVPVVLVISVALSLASSDQDLWWIWVLIGAAVWSAFAAILYGIGKLAGWIRQGFSRPSGS